MKKFNIASFMAGLIIGAIVLGSSMAYGWVQSLEVDIIPLNYYFDGVQKYPPADQQGFVCNGTTYVPLRFMAEASGLSVDWDGNTNSIYVSGTSSGAPTYVDNSQNNQNTGPVQSSAQYMSDVMEPFSVQGAMYSFKPPFDMAGTTYQKGYNFYFTSWGTYEEPDKASFNLGGNYYRITGLIGISDSYQTQSCQVIFRGDGSQLAEYDLQDGALPQELDLDVTGVNLLELEFSVDDPYKDTYIGIGDAYIQ